MNGSTKQLTRMTTNLWSSQKNLSLEVLFGDRTPES
jgi:hypothetical protein